MKRQCRGVMEQAPHGRRKICVMLDREQMELVEKLSVFLGEEGEAAADRIIERAVRTFTDEKARVLSERYAIDLRNSTLTEMRQYRRDMSVDIAARDTIVLPIRDSAENRAAVFEGHAWSVPGLDAARLAGLQYAAFYWRGTLRAVTHYAKLLSAEPAESSAVLRFEEPERLREPVGPKEPENRLHRPRYTTLALLLGAQTLEELF